MTHRALWLLLAIPGVAWANAGIPMLMLAWPAYVLALVPVIAFEGYMGQRIAGLPGRDALKVAAIGNLWSTLLGIPIVWAALLVVEMAVGLGASTIEVKGNARLLLFPFMSAWLVSDGGVWSVYAAFVVLAVPFCIASIWIETTVALRSLPGHSPDLLRKWIRHANVWSYIAIVAVAVAFPLLGK